MTKFLTCNRRTWLSTALMLGSSPLLAQIDKSFITAAQHLPEAMKATVLDMAWAGTRGVAVGDHGVVLLSDDQGKVWRQAAAVPVDNTLTCVWFADAQHGWAAGHGGVILSSSDAGEHWEIQRLALEEDRPLFSIAFVDAQHGVAVGLWSLLLTTSDGGKTWQEQKLGPPPGSSKADANLMQLFSDDEGRLYIAAERGLVLVSEDRGLSWRYESTGFIGTLWAGTALQDGTLLVAGLRGAIFRSSDGAHSWERITLDSTASITALASNTQGQVLAVGLDGLVATSDDAGRTFSVHSREDRLGLTAALALPSSKGLWLVGSRNGILPLA